VVNDDSTQWSGEMYVSSSRGELESWKEELIIVDWGFSYHLFLDGEKSDRNDYFYSTCKDKSNK